MCQYAIATTKSTCIHPTCEVDFKISNSATNTEKPWRKHPRYKHYVWCLKHGKWIPFEEELPKYWIEVNWWMQNREKTENRSLFCIHPAVNRRMTLISWATDNSQIDGLPGSLIVLLCPSYVQKGNPTLQEIEQEVQTFLFWITDSR